MVLQVATASREDGRPAPPRTWCEWRRGGVELLKEEDIYLGHSFYRILASRLTSSRCTAARGAFFTVRRSPDCDLGPYPPIDTTTGRSQSTHEEAKRKIARDTPVAED